MASYDELVDAAEQRWLKNWTAGPSDEKVTNLISAGSDAPDLELLDHTGASRKLSEFWQDGPALVMFWRHFGCGCGLGRAERLKEEYSAYAEAGINLVIIGHGDPTRSAVYREKYEIECPILCDPDFEAYRAYGLGHYSLEQVLYDAPEDTWCHSEEIGLKFIDARREIDRPLVDDSWMSTAEFIVDSSGKNLFSYAYQFCDNFPDARLFLMAVKNS